MTCFLRTLLLPLLFAAVRGHAAGLPDTGQDTCYNGSAADAVPAANPASVARDAGTHPRQDCRYGSDPAAAASVLTKTGAGAKGFDYTKIANNGTALAAGVALGTASTAWACTRDNITGLTWEVKTAIGTDLRYFAHVYAWYNTDGSTNGGNAGQLCSDILPGGGQCNTQAFVADVNAAALCTYADWRLPTRRELLTLVNAGGSSPTIDPTYFPNTVASPTPFYLSGSSYVPDPAQVWIVSFNAGFAVGNLKFVGGVVRLVRGPPL